MLSFRNIKSYDEGKEKSDILTLGIRKAKAKGDLEKLMELETIAQAFNDEGTVGRVRSLMKQSAYIDDVPDTKRNELNPSVKLDISDSKGEIPAEEFTLKEEIGKPLGRVPNGARGREVNNYNKRANRYLKYQEARIKKAIQNRKYERAVLIGLLLLKNSYSYQVSLLNKVLPGGHHRIAMLDMKELMKKVVNKCRQGTFQMFISRFYILKSDGVRGRPIGSPDYPSRVISRGINDLIYTIFGEEMQKHQHGFKRGKGCGSAIGNVIQELKKNPKVVYEFDLKSFFNTVDISAVGLKMKSKSEILAEVIGKLHHSVIYKLPKEGLKEEAELKKVNIAEGKSRLPVLRRDGMPQGLSISPVLSILAMELWKAPKGTTMYADDGIYCGSTMVEFNEGVKRFEDSGVELAENKSKMADREIKFLGCTLDRVDRTVSFEGKLYSGDNPNLEDILMRIYNGYKKQEQKPGTGHIDGNSFTALHNPGVHNKMKFPFYDGLCIIYYSLVWGLPYIGYRGFPSKGIIDIIGGSSYACNGLLSIKEELKLGAKLPLRPDLSKRILNGGLIKKQAGHNKYFEFIGDRSKYDRLSIIRYQKYGKGLPYGIAKVIK